jgi:hypothetical protein
MRIASRRMSLVSALAAAVIGALVATAAPAQAATVVARWNMEDGGTTMADATGHGHTGTLHGVAVRQPGQSGFGFGFSGTPAYVSVPSSSAFSPGTQNIKLTASVRFSTRPSSSVGDYDIIRRGLSSTSGGDYKLEILGGGQAFCLFRGSAGQVQVTGGANLANNAWHTLSCSRAGNTVVLTVDGSSVSRTGSTGSIANSATVYIGAKNTAGADQYRGVMDNVSVTIG